MTHFSENCVVDQAITTGLATTVDPMCTYCVRSPLEAETTSADGLIYPNAYISSTDACPRVPETTRITQVSLLGACIFRIQSVGTPAFCRGL